MPRFSIIVPVYNVERYVGECVESLRRQTFDDFEAVCVNDGSTDRSVEVARRAAGEDARFVFVDRANGGLSAARNTGLEAATGDYVCFLDSDDRYVPDALERLARVLADDDLDVLDFSAATFYETPDMQQVHEESYDYRDPIPGVHDGQDLFVLYWEKVQFVSSACFHAIRRSLLEDHGLTFCEGLLHEDELFTPILYAYAQRAAYLDEQLYERRVRPGSIMASPAKMRRLRSLVAIDALLRAWVLEHADGLKPAYIDAFAKNVAYIRDAACRQAAEIDEAALADYLAGMTGAQRAEFALIRFRNDPADVRLREVAESRDYQLGHVALAAPRALKHALSRKQE